MESKFKIFCFMISLCLITSTFTIGIHVKAAETGEMYYVSTDGSDTNPGSFEQPWASLAFAAGSLSSGDTLYIRGGTYLSNQLTISKSGTTQLPITIKAYSDGIAPPELPIINMENKSGSYGGSGVWFNDGTSNIILDGIKVLSTRATLRGIDMMPYPFPGNYNVHRNVVIKNCILEDNSFGIGIGCSSGIIIESCSFDNIGGNLMAIPGVQDGQGDGDAVAILNSEKIIVKDCYFGNAGHYSFGTGIWTRDAIETPLLCKDIIFRNNLIENHWGGGLGFGGTSESVAEDNIVKYIGEALINYPKAGMMVVSDNNIVRRNIFMKAASVMYDPGITMQSFGTATCVNNRIYKNIFYKNGREGIRISQRDAGEVKDNKVLNNIMYSNRVAGPEKMNWLPSDIRNEDMWYNMQVEARTVSGTVAWTTGTANNNNFYNNDFLPYADNRDYPGYSRFLWIGLKTTDKFYSLDGISTLFPTAFFNNIEENPMFINEGIENDNLCDFNLQAGSPCVDSGAHFTKTTEAGTNTTELKVEDARFFTDGCGLMPADKVKIGANEPISITEIDYTNNVITLASPVTYAAGENVDLPYNGSAPDMGVYESTYSVTRTEKPTATLTPTPEPTLTPTPEPTLTPTPEPTVTPTPVPVLSDIYNHRIYPYIQSLVERGIINGYEDGTFRPDNSITRAEFCTIIVKALIYNETISDYVTTTGTFTDVPESEWYTKYIETAYSNNFINGIGEGKFDPEANITRQEMAKILSLAYCKVNSKDFDTLKADADPSELGLTDLGTADLWATDYINVAIMVSLMRGNEDNSFAPLGLVTRGETAVVTNRILGLAY